MGAFGDSNVFPDNERGVGSYSGVGPATAQVFVLDGFLLTAADNYAPLTSVNLQFFDEFCLTVHGLKLEVGVYYSNFMLEFLFFPILDLLHFNHVFNVDFLYLKL